MKIFSSCKLIPGSLLALSIILSLPTIGFAKGGVILGTNESFEKDGALCGLIEGEWLPVKIKKGKATPLSVVAKKLIKKGKKLIQKGNIKKGKKVRKNGKKTKKKNKADMLICPDGPPAPDPALTCPDFASNGDTTCFGIPAGVVGNLARGETQYANVCAACHGAGVAPPDKGLGLTYSELTTAMSGQALHDSFLFSLSVQNFADITAERNSQ